ncbi:MAG: hypothetical protein HN778_13780 [Prolixibacteraceae bacterium]|jgi:hypothetical protein|nr:hypothetical protein [Prolixibacteraceae bacterium]MBT6007527.1 hypothetical protein [Prolixibacteraceae bacterium]MBT6763096.1 hypothetical protein [Prolixibacteraceae bacterium]MBT6999506.1 hypothetical protein [Prolixibacteraceae bacterium]MBT7395896.1 hypothetical protein [Prolixibacteraceae bacterium]
MNDLKDIKLKTLLSEMKLETPKSDFSVQVMNKIFEENYELEKIKSARILGNGFWVFVLLFIVLFMVFYVISNIGSGAESDFAKILPEIKTSGFSNAYQSFFEKLGTGPLSIAGILLASSLLLFIEQFFSSRSKIVL